MRELTRISPEEAREFVAEHFRRNPNCDWEHLAAGWRVKSSRPMDSRETLIVRQIYDEQIILREERIAAERAAIEARKPKGPINKFLAMRWWGQMLLGLAIFLVALYAGAMAYYPLIEGSTLAGGTAATGARYSSPRAETLSPGARGFLVPAFDHPGVQAATSILFWVVLVTGGVGGIVILFIAWGIGFGIVQACRAILRRPAT